LLGQQLVSNFVIQDWVLKTSGGAKVYINDIEAPSSMILGHGGVSGMLDFYTIPAVSHSEVTVSVKGSNFSDYTKAITPKKNSGKAEDMEDVVVPLSIEEAKKAFEAIKQLWNDTYKDVIEGGAKASELKKYFASDADANMPDDIIHYYTMLEEGYDTNFRLTDIGFIKDTDSYFCTDNAMFINFGYRLDYEVLGSSRNMTRKSQIVVKIENGNYKILSVPDSELFSYSNHFTHDWSNV
jgi:hypothetical protein